jgi:Zn-finger nucleic acid-binding protein
MKCPVCPETDLIMTERQGVEIDYCPKCRGVWLDRGELDKIIERSTAKPDSAGISTEPAVVRDGRYRGQDHHGHDDPHHGYKRRKSWLGELFD